MLWVLIVFLGLISTLLIISILKDYFNDPRQYRGQQIPLNS